MKHMKDIIPNYLISKKAENEWCSRMVKTISNNLKWYDFTPREFEEEFIKIFQNSTLYASSYFEVKKKDNISSKNIPLEALCSINIFGIFFMQSNNKDRPVYIINYDDLIYIIGFSEEIKLSFIDKNLHTEIKVTLHCLRSREMAEDIMTHAQLRTMESNNVIFLF